MLLCMCVSSCSNVLVCLLSRYGGKVYEPVRSLPWRQIHRVSWNIRSHPLYLNEGMCNLTSPCTLLIMAMSLNKLQCTRILLLTSPVIAESSTISTHVGWYSHPWFWTLKGNIFCVQIHKLSAIGMSIIIKTMKSHAHKFYGFKVDQLLIF